MFQLLDESLGIQNKGPHIIMAQTGETIKEAEDKYHQLHPYAEGLFLIINIPVRDSQ